MPHRSDNKEFVEALARGLDVIRAFNANKTFDRFTVEQLAALSDASIQGMGAGFMRSGIADSADALAAQTLRG